MKYEGAEFLLRKMESGEDNVLNYYYVGAGSYKVVYSDPGNADQVIKFCAEDNETRKEADILALAEEEELDSFFLPTSFHFFDEEEFAVEDILGYIEPITAYEIQPYVEYNEMDDWERIQDIYSRGLAVDEKTGETLSREDLDALQIHSPKWLHTAINNQEQGIEELRRLAQFVSKHRITDLHTSNLGIYQGRAVILDWLS